MLMAKKTAKKVAKRAAKISPNQGAGTPHPAAPSPVLAKPEIKKIQGLLKSKTTDGVTLGLSLLESLGATRGDYEAVFTERVIRSVLGGWVAESWAAVAKVLAPHGAVSDLFQRLAEEKYLKRPGKGTTLRDFVGLARARAVAARPAFLAAWGKDAHPEKPFLDLVDIPAGSFMMGSPENEAGRSNDENQVQVRITKPFRMGRTVVTQSRWREVMGTEPWRHERLNKNQCGDDFPAVYVSWGDAVLFCQMLTELERETGRLTGTQTYRLPTEAEWEYACRAGTTAAYSFGDNPALLGAHGWYADNSGERLHRVAEKKPNPWGLFDMHGNVLEWCADWYDATLAGGNDPVRSAQTSVPMLVQSPGSNRVYRGGRWSRDASRCRSATRFSYIPWRRNVRDGFRVVV